MLFGKIAALPLLAILVFYFIFDLLFALARR